MPMSFIPNFHFIPASEKLKPDFCKKVINYYYFNTHNIGLLDGKKIKEIDDYASGNFSVLPFIKMFKSMKKKLDQAETNKNIGQDTSNHLGVEISPLPMIPVKLNAAISTIQKIPAEVAVKATDTLATHKKKEDIQFLKNKPQVEADLDEVASMMGLPKADLGTTKHSAVPYSDMPYGLDLADPDQLSIFDNILYSLGIETAYETVLQHWYDIRNIQMIRLLQTRDQLKYGVSVQQGFKSSITHLPDMEYVFPEEMKTPFSRLPDFSDNTHRIRERHRTAMEVFNLFGDEIGTTDKFIETYLNAKGTGYCACNGLSLVDGNSWGTLKINVVHMEVKSVDWAGVARKRGGNNFEYFTDDEEKISYKIWGQNTYSFYWLKNTEFYFCINRLDGSYRAIGKECFQNFSSSIYKSQEKSCVEMAIGENKKAQVAEVKLMYHILKALPSGKYIDLRFLRGAISGLKESHVAKTVDDLVTLAFEQNVMIGDTSGFDGKADAQLSPLKEIMGGVKLEEIRGYLQVIAQAEINISRYTGINDQLTGQSPNPEGLVGLQKLLINSSLNTLYQYNEAISFQLKNLFARWANIFKASVEEGGEAKKGIIAIIGAAKTNIIDQLDDLPLHTVGIVIDINQREIERQQFEQKLEFLEQQRILTTADEFMLRNVRNPKDQLGLLAIREKMALQRSAQQQQQQFAQQQQLSQQQGQNQVAAKQAETDGKIKQIYAQGDVQSKIIQLSQQLGMNQQQFLMLAKRTLQQDRMQGQEDKSLKTLDAKNNLEQQAPLV